MSPADDDSTNITTFDKQRLEEVHPLVDRLDLWALSLRDLRLRSFAWRPTRTRRLLRTTRIKQGNDDRQ